VEENIITREWHGATISSREAGRERFNQEL